MIGAGATLGNFQAKLGLDSSSYAKGMINAESVSRIFGNTFSTFVSNPLLGSIGLLKNVGKAMISGSVEILGYAEEVERMAQISGASEPLIIAMTKRLDIAGFSAERVRQAFLGLNKFLADFNNEGAMSADVLALMGLSLEGLEGTDAIFRAVIESLDQIENPATRAGLAAKFFGEEAGPELINAIGGGSAAIDKMIDQYTRLGFVIEGSANSQLAEMNTSLGFVQQAIEGVKLNTLREFLIGVSGELDVTNEGVIRLAESMNNQLGPAAREAGRWLPALLDGAAPVLGAFNDASDYLGDAIGNTIINNNSSFVNGQRYYFGTPTDEEFAVFKRNRKRAAAFAAEDEFGL